MSIEGLGNTLGVKEVTKEQKALLDQKKKQRREEKRKKKSGKKDGKIIDGRDDPSESDPTGFKGKIDIRI